MINTEILYILLGVLLVFIGYYRGEIHPSWYTLTFSIGTIMTAYYSYSYYRSYRYQVKDIY